MTFNFAISLLVEELSEVCKAKKQLGAGLGTHLCIFTLFSKVAASFSEASKRQPEGLNLSSTGGASTTARCSCVQRREPALQRGRHKREPPWPHYSSRSGGPHQDTPFSRHQLWKTAKDPNALMPLRHHFSLVLLTS